MRKIKNERSTEGKKGEKRMFLGVSCGQMRGVGEAVGIRMLAVRGKKTSGMNCGVLAMGRENPIGRGTFVGWCPLYCVADLRRIWLAAFRQISSSGGSLPRDVLATTMYSVK